MQVVRTDFPVGQECGRKGSNGNHALSVSNLEGHGDM